MLASLAALPFVPLAAVATALEEAPRLRAAIGGGPRLLVKRDDAIGFAFGGNKVRKIRFVAADALARGADTLITCGGVQSNHARVTAAAAAKLGLHCILVVNGTPPDRLAANALRANGVEGELGLRAAELYHRFNTGGGGGLDFSAIITDIRARSNAEDNQ